LGFDYRSPGAFFVTICLQARVPLLAEIDGDGNHQLSPAGLMVDRVWRTIPTEFSDVQLDEHIVMPDHVHGIVMIDGSPDRASRIAPSQVIQWFKTVTMKRYGDGVRQSGLQPYDKQLWQRSYYDHIIRDDNDLARCRNYIAANPWRWAESRKESPSVGED
jgi:putative transposase